MLLDGVLSRQEPKPPCDERTVRRWLKTAPTEIAQAIGVVTSQVLRSQALSRQEQAFLRGTIRGYLGLARLRAIALGHGFSSPASCLVGWANQMRYPRHPLVC